MSNSIREPKQQRSIDTKNRIVLAGYELFAEKGYFSTNTAEIAKCAGVSTGIVYGYFHDKRDIMIDVLDIYIEKVFLPILETFRGLDEKVDFNSLVPEIVDEAVLIHQNNARIHEALHSLSASDQLVNEKFLQLEDNMTRKIEDCFLQVGFVRQNLPEKIHVALTIIQSFAHEKVYDNHSYLNYDEMRRIVISTVVGLFE